MLLTDLALTGIKKKLFNKLLSEHWRQARQLSENMLREENGLAAGQPALVRTAKPFSSRSSR